MHGHDVWTSEALHIAENLRQATVLTQFRIKLGKKMRMFTIRKSKQCHTNKCIT